jgi:uncharacterized protein (TIGR02266 family)
MEGSQRSEATPRLPVELEVDCATEQMAETVTLTSQDVGEGGLFLKTEFPLDPGTRFGCRLHMDGEPLLAEGEVAWIRNGPPESDPPPGMGVRFVAVNPDETERLRQFVLGIEADADGEDSELPRVSFQLAGLGQPLPGEFRAMSESGLAAVAELPFLQVGSTVQVNIDEPGREGPVSGRIAWLSLEQDEEADENQTPKIRLGIHFDAAPVPAPDVDPGRSLSNPVDLTELKDGEEAESVTAGAVMAGPVMAGAMTTLAEPTPEEIAAVDTSFQTPWQADIAARPRSARSGRRRRVRSRHGAGGLNMVQAWSSLRDRAAKNPKAALGVGAGALVLLLTLGMAFAFGGSDSKKTSKASKPSATANLAVTPTPRTADTPSPSLADPAPTRAPAPAGATVAGAPPLPSSGLTGKAVLANGPGVNADPGKVLAKGAATGKDLLADPGKAARKVPKRVHSFTLGGKLVVKLSLQAKPGRVKHYLLANPSGAVIDVAGATPSLAPGRYKVADGRVRMVKVLHRGKGARFIVYYGKKVKKPKITVVTGKNGVSFVMRGVRPARRAVAKRSAKPRRKGLRKGVRKAVRGRRMVRRTKTQARRKTRTSRKVRRKPVRRKPIRSRHVAPVADATDD